MSEVERLARERRLILLWFTVLYAIWYGALIVALSGWVRSSLVLVFDATVAIGSIGWFGVTFWLARWNRRVRASGHALAALDDELTVRNRWRAQRASMFVLLGCLLVGVAVTSFVDVSGRIAMEMLIWMLVVSQLGFYLWYDRG